MRSSSGIWQRWEAVRTPRRWASIGAFGPAQLAGERVGDPAIHELAARVRVHADEEMDRVAPMDWPVFVDITLAGGRHVARRLDRVVGCPNRPMTDSELAGKFLGNVDPVIGPERARRVLDACMDLEGISDVSELMGWLAPQR
jgi:2-methylcitrate dehydratase